MLPQNSGEANKHAGESAEQAAKAVGVSRQIVQDAERVAKHAPEVFEVQAEQRMHLDNASKANLPESQRGEARDKAAAAVGVSGRTLSKSRVVTPPAPAPKKAHMFTLWADPNAPQTFKAAMAEAEKTGVLRVPFKALCGPGLGTTVQLVKNDRKEKHV